MEAQIAQLYNPLFLYIRKRINSKEDAEDLTQEVFLKLSKSDSDKVNNVKSWVYTIAKNTITDYYRKRKLYTTEVDDVSIDEEITNEDVIEDLTRCITPFINELPEEYRSILTLSEIENVPQKEIAKQLDMNYVTVRSKIQRGRKKLRGVFEDCCSFKQGGKGSILEYHSKSKPDCEKNDC